MGRAPRLDEVVAILKAHEDFFRAKGVTRLSVFGSVARGDATADSDVDLVIDLAPQARFTLFDLVHVEQESSCFLGRKVDVVARDGLKRRIADAVDKDGIDVFRA